MSRYCLAVGLFLGLLARSFSPSASENPPPHDANGLPVVAQPCARRCRTAIMPRPARRSTRRPRPRMRRAITWPIFAPGRCI